MTSTNAQPTAMKGMSIENAQDENRNPMRLRGGCIPCPGAYDLAFSTSCHRHVF